MTANRYEKSAESSLTLEGSVYPFYLRIVFASVCVAAIIYFVVVTFRWPVIWDETVMHYVNFLMAHGMAPYRDIYDLNLPGIYLVDGWQMHLFGPGDLAARFYEFFLLGSLVLAMIAIALPYDWLAGLVAGVIFILFHAIGGPSDSTQRDEIITVLLLVGYALLFRAVRRKHAALLLPFGICMGFAICIKPTAAPLVLVLVLMALYVLKKSGNAIAGYIGYGIVGSLIPVAITLHFLFWHQAMAAFLDLSGRLTPYYAGMMKEPALLLIHSGFPIAIRVPVILAVVIAVVDREWVKNWERWALLLGAAVGLFSFVIQGKGYEYHKYPLVAFITLWACLEFTRAIRKQGWLRLVGFAGLFSCVFWIVPSSLRNIHRTYPMDVAFMQTLESDLTQLGGDKLQHQVQCLDMVDGCLGALYHLNLVQNTGFTGDTLFFVLDHSPAVEYYRRIFWDDIHKAPPKVFVVSDEWFNWPRGFSKINNWPEFADFLNSHYTLYQTRTFGKSSYRIYLLKDAGSI